MKKIKIIYVDFDIRVIEVRTINVNKHLIKKICKN